MSPRILLVEDNKMNQLVARSTLAKLGCESEIANDGAEAVSYVAAQRFDLVLMDCQMPVLDGYDATRHIRGLDDERARSIPVIGLSARAMASDRQLAIDAGMDDYLTKPLRIDELRAAIAKWVDGEADGGTVVPFGRRGDAG